jgi:hypothetical protein
MLSDDRLSRLSVYVVFLIPSSCPGDGWRDGGDEGEMRLLLCFVSSLSFAVLLCCVLGFYLFGAASVIVLYTSFAAEERPVLSLPYI